MFREAVTGIAKNASIMLFQQIVTWTSTFLLMLVLPRHYGPLEYGKLFLGLAIVDVFRIFVAYGGNYLIAKNVSRDRPNTAQIVVDASAFRIILAAIAGVGLVVFTLLMDYPLDIREVILITGLGLLWQGIITPLYASFQGLEMMQYTSAGAVAERIFASGLAIAAVFLGAPIWMIALIMVLGNLVNFLVLAAFFRKITTSIPRVNWKEVLGQVRSGVPYFLFAVFSMIYYRIDSMMLSKMSPGEVVGWYGGAFRLFDVLNFFPYILTVALFPVLSRLWKDSDATHRRTTLKSLELVILAGIPISISMIAFAGEIIHILYGLNGYGPSVPVLQVLSSGLLFLYVDMILVTMLLASDRQSQFSIVSLVAIPVKIVLNFFLIPYFQSHDGNGGIGAAIATIFTECCIMIAALSLTPATIRSAFRVSILPKGVLAGAAMVAIVWFAKSLAIPWFLTAAVALAAYGALLLALRTLEPAEKEALATLLRVRSRRELLGILQPVPAETEKSII